MFGGELLYLKLAIKKKKKTKQKARPFSALDSTSVNSNNNYKIFLYVIRIKLSLVYKYVSYTYIIRFIFFFIISPDAKRIYIFFFFSHKLASEPVKLNKKTSNIIIYQCEVSLFILHLPSSIYIIEYMYNIYYTILRFFFFNQDDLLKSNILRLKYYYC